MCIYRHKPIICSKRVCQERGQVKARQELGGREGNQRCRSKQEEAPKLLSTHQMTLCLETLSSNPPAAQLVFKNLPPLENDTGEIPCDAQ